jgi:glycosyltransferase involved in cell wall biosynthesis
MRVLLTVPSLAPEFGGPAVKVPGFAEALRATGADVRVAGCGPGEGAIGLPVLFSYHGTPVPRSVRRLTRSVHGADVVHVIGFRDPVGTAAALAASRAGIPYVLEPVGMHRPRIRSIALKRVHDAVVGRWVVERSAAIVATSRLEARELEEDGVDPGKVHLRPNGIDVEAMLPLPRRGAFRRSVGIPKDVPLALALGRITRKKGLVDLVSAVRDVPGLHAVVVGPDDGDGTVDEIQRVRTSLRLEDRVHVLARGIWGAEKAQAFADADVFCLPSATENFGIAAAEAAAVGLPVIVSDICGVMEYLDPASTRVVPLHDNGALVGALAALTEDAGARASAGAKADALRDALSWPRVAERQIEIYQLVLSR